VAILETADDRVLVASAQDGDRRALDVLLRRHYDRVHAICRRIAGSGRDADDAAQEAMISIVRGLARFDGRSAFSTWTYRIATNAALDELRRRDRRPALQLANDANGAHDVADPLSHHTVEAVADRLSIDDALAELPDDYKVAVVLRDVCDLDYAEIAAVIDVPVGTVKSRIARGRQLLVRRLGNRDDQGERPSTDEQSDYE
jgi:RNA polymerase sigma-70 factor (ECF subfamily)